MEKKTLYVLSSVLFTTAIYASHNENYHSDGFNWNVGSGYVESESNEGQYKFNTGRRDSDDAHETDRGNDSDHANDHDSGHSDNDSHDSGHSDNDSHDSGHSDNDSHDSGHSDSDDHDD